MSRSKRYQMTPDKHLNQTELNTLKDLLSLDISEAGLIITLLLETGARVSELLLTEPSDIQHDTKSLHITGIKDSLDRVIPLSDSTYERISKHAQNSKGLVFTIKKRWVQHLWTNHYAVQIGASKTLHCLRHTFAIELYKKCQNIRIVQQALGHVNIENTMVYATYQHSLEALRQALKGA